MFECLKNETLEPALELFRSRCLLMLFDFSSKVHSGSRLYRNRELLRRYLSWLRLNTLRFFLTVGTIGGDFMILDAIRLF